ncbi:MAG: winged helix-turn-helix transcriptional regulator [Nanoarchaeota archaeon]|nr:winged helix-turn-helix transcriptional regulator [Nanoarchaeota archaeon]MBU1004694.1 winged helix-turn-helix transcriptional regulator [Nanoarchaeota archaeon]MBU1945377.1 winged helix-turn-helix transcriptional regulator [Nanoarchaeota archaeon]
MALSKTELKVLEQIAKDNNSPQDIAKSLKKSKSQVYRAVKSLQEKGFIIISRKKAEPAKSTHVSLLLQLLLKYPNSSDILADSGLNILIALLEPKKIKEIPIKQATVYSVIKKGMDISAVRKSNGKYFVNDKLWKELREFLVEYLKYISIIDLRVPANAEIYYKTDSEIVFSSPGLQKADLTAFSAYEDYGIKILGYQNYYHLPQKKLTLKEVFLHSLYVTEKDMKIQHLIFVALFYIKYKKNLTNVKHTIIECLKQVLSGKKVEGYPTLAEIKDRADVYDIRI